jgi:molybdopterin synthase sulfur carrier subunit
MMREERAFRGISKRLAVHYLGNLGGELVAGDAEDSEEARVEGEGWTATLSAEKVTAAGSMKLTEVTVVFEGESEVVEPLVESFAQKAMRAGG